MLIQKIILHNIRSYEHAEIEINTGMSLLSGDIGCGKSTVLVAIEFCLFGLIKGELSGGALLRNGCQKGWAETTLMIGNKAIIVKRTLKRSSTGISQENATLSIDGVIVDVAPIELKAKIFELLQYPMDGLSKKTLLYRYTIYTPQEEMKRIVFEDAETRLDVLRKIFGLDKYKAIRDNSVIVDRTLREQIKQLDIQSSDREDIKKRIIEYSEKIDQEKKFQHDARTKKDDTQKRLVTLEEEHLELQKRFEDYQIVIQEKNNSNLILSNLQKELESITSMQNSVEQQLVELTPVQISSELQELITERGIERSYEECNVRIKKLTDLITDIRAKQAAFNQRIQDVEIAREKNNARMKVLLSKEVLEKQKKSAIELQENATKDSMKVIELLERKKNLEQTRNSLIVQKAGYEQQKMIAKKTADAISTIDICPTCKQHVDETHKHEITHEQKNLTNAIEIKSSGIQAELTKQEQLLQTVEKELLVSQQAKQLLSQYEMTIQNINEKIGELSRIEKEDLELLVIQQSLAKEKETHTVDKIPEFDTLVKIHENHKRMCEQLISYENKKALLTKTISDIGLKKKTIQETVSKQIVALKNIEERLLSKTVITRESVHEKQRLKEQVVTAVHACDLQLKEHDLKIHHYSEQLDMLSKELIQKEKWYFKKMDKSQIRIWLDEAFLPTISSIEKSVLTKAYQECNELFQTWFSMLLEDEMVTAHLSEDFTPLVQQNGYDIEAEHLSGGEKTALSLAYRLALNKTITDLTTGIQTKGIIILDEPTDGFSSTQLDRMRDLLQMLGMEQIIIVSHEQKMESYVEHIIRIEKQNHVSRIVGI